MVKWTLKRLKKWDIDSLERVDYFIANSNFVQERIKQVYPDDDMGYIIDDRSLDKPSVKFDDKNFKPKRKYKKK